jgi:hypothetical protein
MKKNIFSKFKKSLRYEGLIKTILRIINYAINQLKNKQFQNKLLSIPSNEDRFTWIYKKKIWSKGESRSGPGSTLKYTENLRKELPILFQKYSIQKVFDAPCGDFNWMSHLLPTVKIEYIGADIVKPLIENLNSKYKSNKISFVHFDLIKEIPPKVDLIICRDCLFHLSFQDTKAVLKNFIKSKSAYLLTTTHKNMGTSFANRDILTGDCRSIDLFSPPYNFSTYPLFIIEDGIALETESQMCLWSREQIILSLEIFNPN